MKTEWNEEEIRKAIVEAPVADVIMGKLKIREIRSDCPMVYDSKHGSSFTWGPGPGRALIREDTVMTMIDECFSHREMALYSHEFRDAMQAAIDAYKYEGESNG